MNKLEFENSHTSLNWGEDTSHIPYWVYQHPEILRQEQEKIYQGPTWGYLCLEAEIPNAGDYITTFVGEMPVVVTRDQDGEIYAFENRCAHRGALIAITDSGSASELTCVYHAWSYDLSGSLKGIAFQNGVGGKGGMPADFQKEHYDPRKLRVATVCGIVFGSLDEDVPSIEDYLGEEILGRIERVLHKPVRVLGKFKQMLPNNWKLYFENVKDTYHASLLHVFFTTFKINRLSQRGGVIVSDTGAHHVSYSVIDKKSSESAEYQKEKLRSDKDDYRLADPSLLEGVDEFGDGVTLQILSVFPGFVLQQIQNSIAVRQILPKGVESTELNWTYIGFEDDSAELEEMRLKQANLIGASGFVSMEDGAVGGFVQRGIQCASDQYSVVQMGGVNIESADYRATETSVRGFWHAYRSHMGL
ncbi:aromatic ring-hydroxylating dioxygenase subunit alpha [Neopusillimonas maritima]|uniref:Rieske (2Fe-2S) protein n=1 Tax=Neopusillimonas maritima TaxID=2026239 RepID=A0A3A1YW06_9BURK|nr:aromatic ring-hydroxylating dioxygenase subunit alpha [Neopusillimonas maritima]RIY42443.1 Rieske (2Fe-2S) protein [Neopusillimonas maritima]